MVNDSLSDMLIRIKNGYLAGSVETSMPTSKLRVAVAKVLVSEKYVTSAEVNALRFVRFSGNYENLTATFIDDSGVDELFDNTVYLTYYTQSLFWYQEQWAGWVPRSQVEKSGNQITVRIGQLPIDRDYFKPRRHIDVEFVVRRSTGANHRDLPFDVEHQIER